MIVPVPKKGNLQSYDNWRVISLLDVHRKFKWANSTYMGK